ncbi:MAG: serine/threonine protein kinase [Planctomycetia bacterium]|nr:serine/threonine protein kinase [Planctomycetia bacterium]
MTERSTTPDWSANSGTTPTTLPQIPGYEIIEELGRGGMGVVYKALQVHLKRLVALKLIRDSALASPQERARFQVEAESAARMHHPNIVQIFEVGEHQGQPYFAMELVEGGSLDKLLAGRALPARHSAELVRSVALAIHHAHTQKIVHRDLKPANILLSAELGARNSERESSSPPDSADFSSALRAPSSALVPKVTDFGLAKRLDSESTTLTRDGAVVGTASYMAPEQAAGRVREIGPAVDVYALGAILYELLTGRPPFRGDTWSQTVEQVLRDEPVPLTRLQADVPRDLETVCLKCLEKEPTRRYASAAELADDLSKFLDGQPVVAVPLSAQEQLARFAARDGYQLLEEIGRGARSVVYRALVGPLKQPVALKVFNAGICTQEEWEARMRRGADLWVSLAHPSILLVQRAGWWNGAPYLAVEFVPHGSLAERPEGQPYSIPQALRVVEQLAEVVCYLHRQGVVHGNLKPSNVLLAADGIPRVIDLRPTSGLSLGALLDVADPASVGYLAPELVQDANAEARPHTDVYGLGILLYELLAGRPPFEATTAQEMLEQVRSQEPAPPSRFNPKVTPHLDWFCFRCLKKNPWRRFSRAYDVLTRLRDFQENPEDPNLPGQRRPKRPPSGGDSRRGS